MTFTFAFSGDDIEQHAEDSAVPHTPQPRERDSAVPPPVAARAHGLDELLSTLPDTLSFSTTFITSSHGRTVRLPRRELFDVRLQLMAEDDGRSPNQLVGLDDSDVRTNVYEGGYKTWEGSIDLVNYLLDHPPGQESSDLGSAELVVEMGCGSALPSLLLFKRALESKTKLRLVLTDYNLDVLRLVTLPNLLLTWAMTLDQSSRVPFDNGSSSSSSNNNNSNNNPLLDHDTQHGHVRLTPALLAAFAAIFSTGTMAISFLSGSWHPASAWMQLVPLSSSSSTQTNTLILASETIYSHASLVAFTEAIAAMMARVTGATTLLAAKKVYFGVGGTVDGFMEECAKRGCVARQVDYGGLQDQGQGVTRCLVQVQGS